MILDVAAGKDLFPKEIYGGIALGQRHALMIGREDEREIQTQEGLMGDGEENGVRETEQVREQAEIPTSMEDQEANFEDGMSDFIALKEADTVVFQNESLEQRQREKREMLVSHGEAREAVLPCYLVFRECERN